MHASKRVKKNMHVFFHSLTCNFDVSFHYLATKVSDFLKHIQQTKKAGFSFTAPGVIT